MAHPGIFYYYFRMDVVLVLSAPLLHFVTLSKSVFAHIYNFLSRKMWGRWWLLTSQDTVRFMFYWVRVFFFIKHYPLSVSNFISTFSKYHTAIGVLTLHSFVDSKPCWIPPVLSQGQLVKEGRWRAGEPMGGGVSGRSQQLDSGSGGLRSDYPILSTLGGHVTTGDQGFRAEGSRTQRFLGQGTAPNCARWGWC